MFTVYLNGKAAEIVDFLKDKARYGKLDTAEKDFYRKLVKTIGFLEQNPRHPGLHSHEIFKLITKIRLENLGILFRK